MKAERHSPLVHAPPLWNEEQSPGRATAYPELVIDIDGFEGPLDLLLYLARRQKVDLAQISLLALVKQYLDFVADARKVQLELAADYLVTAAWLAYLKSRLLVPKSRTGEETDGETLGEMLQFRLQRLEAMREAARMLFARNLLGHDIFARGAPEMVVVERHNRFDASLYELLDAYAGLRQRGASTRLDVGGRRVWSLEAARSLLERWMGEQAANDWLKLDSGLMACLSDGKERSSALASAFAASLEMVREGEMEIYQEQAFAPLYLRRCDTSSYGEACG